LPPPHQDDDEEEEEGGGEGEEEVGKICFFRLEEMAYDLLYAVRPNK
jgi:hypothetical protein